MCISYLNFITRKILSLLIFSNKKIQASAMSSDHKNSRFGFPLPQISISLSFIPYSFNFNKISSFNEFPSTFAIGFLFRSDIIASQFFFKTFT